MSRRFDQKIGIPAKRNLSQTAPRARPSLPCDRDELCACGEEDVGCGQEAAGAGVPAH